MTDWREGLEHWPRPFVDIPLDASQSAFVMVDMQRYFIDPLGPDGERLQADYPDIAAYFFKRLEEVVIPNLATVLEGYRLVGLPVVHVTSGPVRSDGRDLSIRLQRRYALTGQGAERLSQLRVGSPWHAVVEALSPRDDELVVNKLGWSAFNSTAIEQLLRNLGVSHLVVGGFATNGCVELTARDAADRGFETYLVEDGCATFTEEAHVPALRTFQRLHGTVLMAAAVVKALDGLATPCGSSGEDGSHPT